jgi:predicted RNase H-like HicB family nuclease
MTRVLEYEVYKEDDAYFAENKELSVVGYGETEEDAIEDFKSHIEHLINYYKNIEDNRLTANALIMKGKFLNLES